MRAEDAIKADDICVEGFQKPISVQSGSRAANKPTVFKQGLQTIRLSDEDKHDVMATLRHIYGPKFELKDASSYQNTKSNITRNYWINNTGLVVMGARDFSKNTENPDHSEDARLKEFAELRLESYGFHKTHCVEALNYFEGSIEAALSGLCSKYFCAKATNLRPSLSQKELDEIRLDEKSSLESIYETCFVPRTTTVWVVSLKLEYLICLYHNKETKTKPYNEHRSKNKCRNFMRGHCKFGNKCRFLHINPDVVERDVNEHLTDFQFDLEIRLTPHYPFEVPHVLLKTNAVLPELINLHICKRLHNEASLLAEDGVPSVYAIVELLKNEHEILNWIRTEPISFPKPTERLFVNTNMMQSVVDEPSHYAKGCAYAARRRQVALDEVYAIDKKLSKKYFFMQPKLTKQIEARKLLPAWQKTDEILQRIDEHQVVVISGETGCGKSTQVAQFILDDALKNYEIRQKHVEIICTQPRRISAVGLAERVAEERSEGLGQSIGYQIRLESKSSVYTRITFCTTGILLRRLQMDRQLDMVTHVIVDEVHERSVECDLLLMLLRELLDERKDIRVILMSATLNANLFCDYFAKRTAADRYVPMVSIPGRTFPVTQYFLEDILDECGYVLEQGSELCRKITDKDIQSMEIQSGDRLNNVSVPVHAKDCNLNFQQILARYKNYSEQTGRTLYLMNNDIINNDLIESVLMWVVSGDHDYPRVGTILVFLPGMAEITALIEQLEVHPVLGLRSKQFMLLPLHSSLTSEEQQRIFWKPRENVRKIVISTNLAETSITIDDCVFVIDCGRMKEKRFDPNRNMESLDTVWVTRANARQRCGRAGRVMPGVCVHLYTRFHFDQMAAQPLAEIQRIPLEQLLLTLKLMPHIGEQRSILDVLAAFIEPPAEVNVSSAIVRLQNVGAFDNAKALTALGHHLAQLPVDVRIGKLILYGCILSCADAALTIAACLSYRSPFVSPVGKRTEASAKKAKFALGHSDHITVLLAYRKWLELNTRNRMAGKNFARENFLSYKTLVTLADIKRQFLEYVVDIGFIPTDLSEWKRSPGVDLVAKITGEDFNRNGQNVNVLSAVLCAALYPHVVKVLTPGQQFVRSAAGAVPVESDAKDLKFTTVTEMVAIHPSSVNYSTRTFSSPYLVYQEKVRTSRVFVRDCTMVSIMSLVLFSGYDLEVILQNNCTFISLADGWILFQVEQHEVAEMLKAIRLELLGLLEKKIRDPLLNLLHDEKGRRLIHTIYNLINGR